MAAINTILSGLTEAVADDATITNWATAAYSRDALVLENCDFRNDPKAADCPLVIFYPVLKQGGLASSAKSHIIGVSCAVFDSAKPESAGGVVRFTGGRNAEILRGYVVTVIKNTLADDLHIESIVTEYNTIEQFPFVSANMEITITQEKLIGADPYE